MDLNDYLHSVVWLEGGGRKALGWNLGRSAVTQGVCHVAVCRPVVRILTLLSVSDFGYFLTHWNFVCLFKVWGFCRNTGSYLGLVGYCNIFSQPSPLCIYSMMLSESNGMFYYGRLLPTLEYRQCFIHSWMDIIPVCILNWVCIYGMNFLHFSKQKIYITQLYIYFVYYLYPFLTAYFYVKYKSIKLKMLLTVHCIRGLKFSCWFENNSHMFSLNYV